MRRQILLFALALALLCGVLTAVRISAGVDYARLSTVVHLPIVWAMTVGEVVIGAGCCALAWQIARAYNSAPQSRWSFPRVARAMAFSSLALGASSLGDAVCHWLPAYWSLAAVKLVTGGFQWGAVYAWARALPEMRGWFDDLREASKGQPSA